MIGVAIFVQHSVRKFLIDYLVIATNLFLNVKRLKKKILVGRVQSARGFNFFNVSLKGIIADICLKNRNSALTITLKSSYSSI